MSRSIFTKAKFKGAAGVAGLVATGLVIATLPGIATSAAWIDDEWVAGIQGDEPGVGTADCEAPTFSTRGAATFLELNALVLPDVAEYGDLLVTNDGTSSTADPAVSPVGPNPPEVNQYFDDIDLALLNDAISVGLPQLELPLNTDLGVLASYGEAQPDGYSAAGSGLITNTGSVDTDAADDPDLEPFGTLSLSDIVGSVLPSTSPLVNYLADLDLEIGAVGSAATLDACPVLWNEPLSENLTRDYVIAGLDLDVQSSLLGDLTTIVSTLLEDIEALDLEAGLDAALLADLTPLLGGLTSGVVSLENLSVDASVSIDTSALSSILTATYGDDAGIVEINLGTGVVNIDIATLVGGANGLNGLPANTELLINEAVLDALEDAVLEALSDYVDDVTAAIATVLASITITGNITAELEALGITVADVTIPLDGSGVDITLLAIDCLDPVNVALCAVLVTVQTVAIPAIEGLLTLLLDDIIGVVDGALADVTLLVTAVTDLVLDALDLVDVVDSLLFQLLEAVLGGLFDADDGLLSVVVNAQSAPTGNANPIPSNFQDPPVPAGQYDVAAIRIGVLDLLGDDLNVDLTLARSSVGQNIYIP